MLRCGVDLIETERVRAGIDRFGARFLNRFFTAAERALCADQPMRLAARLAAKEAVAKALGTGIGPVRWVDIEILADAAGRPVLHLHGEAARAAADLDLMSWDVSLSHTRDHAIAMVVALPR
jgi:holo-[acyl-carrier protein] synthase